MVTTSNATTIRRQRRRRNRRHLLHVAHKRFDEFVYRARAVSPEYYDVQFDRIATLMRGHRRVFDLHKMGACVVPNARYRRMIDQLIAACKGVMVTIPAEVFTE